MYKPTMYYEQSPPVVNYDGPWTWSTCATQFYAMQNRMYNMHALVPSPLQQHQNSKRRVCLPPAPLSSDSTSHWFSSLYFAEPIQNPPEHRYCTYRTARIAGPTTAIDVPTLDHHLHQEIPSIKIPPPSLPSLSRQTKTPFAVRRRERAHERERVPWCPGSRPGETRLPPRLTLCRLWEDLASARHLSSSGG